MSIRQKAQRSELRAAIPVLSFAPSKLFCCRSTLDAAHCPPAIAGQHSNQHEEGRAFLFTCTWSISAFSRDSCLQLNARACSQPPPRARTHPGQRACACARPLHYVTAAQHELRDPRDAPEAHARHVCQHPSTDPRRADTATVHVAAAAAAAASNSAAATATAAATGCSCASRATCRERHRARRAHHQQPAGPGQSLSSIGSLCWT